MEDKPRPIKYVGIGEALARIFLLWSQTAKAGGTMDKMQRNPIGVGFLFVCSLLAVLAFGFLLGLIKAGLR